MTDIRFYHMLQKRLEAALPEILDKALERGYRVIVKAGSAERVSALDNVLWTWNPAGFMPHGAVRDGFESKQPVWLTTDDDNPNNANMLVLADGAVAQDVGAFELCCELFDGNDADAVKAARERWQVYKDAGHDLSYFQQDEQGRWLKKQ